MTAPIYTIKYTDSSVDPTKQNFTIAPGELNESSTSLKLPGAGYAPYGEPVVQDLVRLLENFASATAPDHPTIGQIWFDTALKQLKVLTGITTTGSTVTYNWQSTSNTVSFSSAVPSSTSTMWYDMSDANPANHVLKIYNTASASWQAVVPSGYVRGTTAPASTSALWYNTTNTSATLQELYVYNTTVSAWQPAVSHSATLLVGAIPDANLATSNIGGNAATATTAGRLSTGRTISLTGGAVGTTVFDGSTNATINVTSINASAITTGTIPVAQLGSAGTRAAGFYLAGNNTWTQMPSSVDAYSKTDTDTLIAARPLRDSITTVGFASNDVTLPYMRRESDGGVYYLQPRLGYTPAPASTTAAGYGITDVYTKAQVNSLIPAIPSYAASLGQTGFFQLPNGVIVNYGRFVTPAAKGANVYVAFTRGLSAILFCTVCPDNAAEQHMGVTSATGSGMYVQKGVADSGVRGGWWVCCGY